MEFLGGDIVEVCSEEEGFLGSYYAAATVKKLEANSYAVQYENLVEEEDMSKQLIETHRKPNAKTPFSRWSNNFAVIEVLEAIENKLLPSPFQFES